MKGILVASAIIGFHTAAFAAAATSAKCGHFVSVSGAVDILRNPVKTSDEENSPRGTFEAANNAEILCDDVIETHDRSSAVFIIPRGKLSIGSNTKVAIAKYSNVEKPQVDMIDLFFGTIRSLITKKKVTQAAPSQFQIRTPTAVAGVRGTDFYVGYNPTLKQTEQATLEGKVEVKVDGAPAPVLVSEGQQVVVDAKAPASTHVEQLSAQVKGKIRSASALVENDPEFVSSEEMTTIGEPEPMRVVEKKKDSKPKPFPPTSYEKPRWIFAFGPSWGKVNHSEGDFNGSQTHGDNFTVQLQHPKKKRSLIYALERSTIEDKSLNDNGVQNSLKLTAAEFGFRVFHNKWWSPYIRAGLGYQKNRATILGESNSWEYISLIGRAGIDVIYKNHNWRGFGLYGALDGQLNQTLVVVNKKTSTNFDDKSMNAFLVSGHLGASFEF